MSSADDGLFYISRRSSQFTCHCGNDGREHQKSCKVTYKGDSEETTVYPLQDDPHWKCGRCPKRFRKPQGLQRHATACEATSSEHHPQAPTTLGVPPRLGQQTPVLQVSSSLNAAPPTPQTTIRLKLPLRALPDSAPAAVAIPSPIQSTLVDLEPNLGPNLEPTENEHRVSIQLPCQGRIVNSL